MARDNEVTRVDGCLLFDVQLRRQHGALRHQPARLARPLHLGLAIARKLLILCMLPAHALLHASKGLLCLLASVLCDATTRVGSGKLLRRQRQHPRLLPQLRLHGRHLLPQARDGCLLSTRTLERTRCCRADAAGAVALAVDAGGDGGGVRRDRERREPPPAQRAAQAELLGVFDQPSEKGVPEERAPLLGGLLLSGRGSATAAGRVARAWRRCGR